VGDRKRNPDESEEKRMKKMTIPLTSEQQKQIKDATGKDIAELNLSFAAQGELSESELGQVQGGATYDVATATTS
jgi:hypothetical protein